MLVLGAAFAFAVVCGLNDGAAMLAAGLRVRGLPPWIAVLGAAGAVVVVPAVLGTAVARTLSERLVAFDGSGGRRALLVSIVVAVVTTSALSRRGLPTSLTLALVGAITGAGVGAGFSVSWSTVAFVLAAAIVAPLVGTFSGWALTAVGAAMAPRSPLHRWLRPAHLGGFGLQALAYGANDGQKMLAVVAVALASSPGDLGSGVMGGIAIAFAVGTVVGLPRIAGTLGGGVVPIQPVDAVVTEVSSATVVLASSAVGAPLSMTQAVSSAMVGTRLGRSRGRVRWEEVGRLVAAWAITLPVALGSAMVGALVTT